MIPKLYSSSRDAWSRDTRSPFQRWPKRRLLRILLDVDSFASDNSMLERIRGFGGDATIQFREVKRADVYLGDADHALVKLPGMEQWGCRGIGVKKKFALMHAEGQVAPDVDSLIRQQVICDVAELFGMDSLVSASSDMLTLGRKYYQAANAMSASECLALIGLFLRVQDNFTFWQEEQSIIYTGRTDFYVTVARKLLPECWRWLALCPDSSAPGAESPHGLAEAVITRFERALRARDRIHEQLMQVPTHNTIDEALFFFDVLLVSLCGAFDAVARVVHQVYAISSSSRTASWRSEHKMHPRKVGWLYAVGVEDPVLGALMHPGAPARDVFELITLLRTTVHSQPLKAGDIMGNDHQPACNYVILPDDEKNKFAEAAKRSGGKLGFEFWGARQVDGGRLALELPLFIERVVPEAARAITSLMRGTKVERFEPSKRFSPAAGTLDMARTRPDEWALVMCGIETTQSFDIGK